MQALDAVSTTSLLLEGRRELAREGFVVDGGRGDSGEWRAGVEEERRDVGLVVVGGRRHAAELLEELVGAPLAVVEGVAVEALALQLAAEDQYQLAVSSRQSAQLAASFEGEGSSAGPLVPPTSAAEEEAMVERALALAASAAAEEEAMVERALAESWRDAA